MLILESARQLSYSMDVFSNYNDNDNWLVSWFIIDDIVNYYDEIVMKQNMLLLFTRTARAINLI